METKYCMRIPFAVPYGTVRLYRSAAAASLPLLLLVSLLLVVEIVLEETA